MARPPHPPDDLDAITRRIRAELKDSRLQTEGDRDEGGIEDADRPKRGDLARFVLSFLGPALFFLAVLMIVMLFSARR